MCLNNKWERGTVPFEGLGSLEFLIGGILQQLKFHMSLEVLLVF